MKVAVISILFLMVTANITLPAACSGAGDVPDLAPVYGYRVLHEYPHDPGAFTQGLVYEGGGEGGVLYEGTGGYGRSSLRKVELETGVVLVKRSLPALYFGEGLTLFEDRLIQLTWTSGKGFVYDKASLTQVTSFRYPGEGWGITRLGDKLVMSDGSATLRILDPETFGLTGRIVVKNGGDPVRGLNELEYVEGEIYANVWPTDMMARIDPETGDVTGWIDLAGIFDRGPEADVLNGIAYDAEGDRLFVTGKLWPTLFEIEIVT